MPSSTVIPVLAYTDLGEAIDWLCTAFGFTERWRAGSHRAQLAVGDGAIAVTEQPVGDAFSSVLVRVEDLDRHHVRAEQHGADPAGEGRLPIRRAAVHRRGSRRAPMDVLADVAPEDWGGTSMVL